jgi:hypothetical protein
VVLWEDVFPGKSTRMFLLEENSGFKGGDTRNGGSGMCVCGKVGWDQGLSFIPVMNFQHLSTSS